MLNKFVVSDLKGRKTKDGRKEGRKRGNITGGAKEEKGGRGDGKIRAWRLGFSYKQWIAVDLINAKVE